MRWLRKIRLRFHSVFRSSRVEADLEDELRDYLDREIELAVAAGASPQEAKQQALATLHGIDRLKEECRDARGVRWFQDTSRDLHFAVRTLRNAPVFAITVIAALAFCIGLNTAIFSVVDTVLFRPLPFPGQEHLVAVTEGVPGLGFPVLPFSPPDYLFVAANNHSFVSTGVYRTQSYEISGVDRPQRVSGARLSASLFHVLGVSPAAGRAFTQAEDDQSSHVAVLSHGFAQSAFGSPDHALGRTLLLNRIPYQVIGVMPRSFLFPIRGSRFNSDPADLFVPVSFSNEDRQQNVSNFDYSMVARLKPDVSLQQVSGEMQRLLKQIVDEYPPKIKPSLLKNTRFSLESHVAPFREEFTGDVQRPLMLLLAAVGVVLLIGCADVANLVFSRMVARQREFALRSALGATRWRLARQTLIEGLLLSIAGGTAGVCIAFWALPLLIQIAPENLPRLAEIGLNWRVAAFVAAITLITPLAFSLAPLRSIFRSQASPLRGEGRTTTQGRHQRFAMSAGVVFQFSLAFVLLATAGLLTRSLIKASSASPGFQPEQVIRVSIALPPSVYKTRVQVTAFFDRLLSRISTLPGVRQTGAISDVPTGSSSNVVISIERRRDTERVDMLFCYGGALESLQVSLLRGRMLQPQDHIEKTGAAVVSESLAKRAWPGQDPIGRRFRFGVDIPDNGEPWLTVIGVVADVKARLTSNAPRSIIFTTPMDWVKQMDVVVRTSGDPLSLATAIHHELAQLDASLPIGNIATLHHVLEESLSPERFRTRLMICFAGAALLLATLGIAGLLAYNVAQRAQEFGVRVALGANRRDLLALVLRQCLRLSVTGIACGLVASTAVTRVLSTLLYETSPLDPATFLAVPVILILVALAAAMLPAWRAARTDPITALRF